MDYEFIGFGAMDDDFACEFIGFGAMDDQFPYDFIGFGVMDNHFAYRRRRTASLKARHKAQS